MPLNLDPADMENAELADSLKAYAGEEYCRAYEVGTFSQEAVHTKNAYLLKEAARRLLMVCECGYGYA